MSLKLEENVPESQVPLVPGLACLRFRVCNGKIQPYSHTAWMLHFSHIIKHNRFCTVHVKIVWLDSCLPMAFLLPELKFGAFRASLPCPKTARQEHEQRSTPDFCSLQSGAFTTVPNIPVTVSLNRRIQALPQTQRLNCWSRLTKWELELWIIDGFLNQSHMLRTNPSLPRKRAV